MNRIELKVYGSLIAGWLALVLAGGLCGLSVRSLALDSKRLAAARDFGARLSRLAIDLKDAEAAVDKFMLTGKRRHSAPYLNAAAAIEEDLVDLVSLQPGDAWVAKRAKELAAQVRSDQRLFERKLRARESEGRAVALQLVLTGDEARAHAAIQKLLEAIRARQDRSIRGAMADSEAQANRTTWILGGSALLVLFLFVIASWIISLDFRLRREQELELIAARERALAATQAKSAFLAHMSHEIRTPLNGVIGMSELMLRSPLDSTQVSRARVIQESSRALLALINGILDLSKIEAGKLELEAAAVDVPNIARQVADLLRFQAQQKSLALDVEISGEFPPRLSGDPTRIRQVLLNLVANAVKFTAQGSVRIRIHSRLEGPAYQVRFDVQDTGIGIPADRLDRLFARFSQADSTTTREYGGTGLGLAISQDLVDLMGGKIQVQSTQGQGSTFGFELAMPRWTGALPIEPPRPAAVSAPIQPSVPKSARGPKHLLLAEDNAVNQMVVLGLLENLGYQVDIASTGRQALEMAARNPYDLVLLDCHMPELDGLDVARCIRATGTAQANVTIVALTASAFEEQRQQCLQAGMNDFLTKPIDPAMLEACLERWAPTVRPVAPSAPSVRVDAPAPDLDLVRLNKIKAIGVDLDRPLFLTEIARTYLETANEHIQLMQQAVQSNDFVELHERAHALRSGSENLGLARVSHLCDQIEENAGHSAPNDPSVLRALVDQLSAVSQRSWEALRAELQEEVA